MQRPVAFSNWPTTDPLKHPNEPYPEEDSMEIDVDQIKAKPSFAPGTIKWRIEGTIHTNRTKLTVPSISPYNLILSDEQTNYPQ